MTNDQIAHNIGIAPRTFREWIRRQPAIRTALKEGKAPVDLEVENALLKSALGHTVTVRKAMVLRTKKQLKDKGLIEEDHVEYVDEEIYIPPQTIAQIFWLKNRRPDKWRDKQPEAQVASGDTHTDDVLTAALREEAARIEAGEKDDAAV